MIFLLSAGTAAISHVLSFFSERLAPRVGAIDAPKGGRKIHQRPTPLLGGLGIGCAIIITLVLLRAFGILPEQWISSRQFVGFIVAIAILLFGGVLDDIRPCPPAIQILFPIAAALVVVGSGTGILQITHPSHSGGFSLVWFRYALPSTSYALSLPADLVTIGWLLVATYATKLLDGLDGLVAGMAVIGSAMVGVLTLSPAYFQPGVALVAGTVGGAFLGFLPRNIHPAKQFLGEAGSTLAGFSLGVLAVLSSAKVAIALAVLAIPIADAVFVVIGRLRRGAPPWQGDATHLHFRLLNLGIPHRTVVILLWAVSFAAGLVALTLQTRGKLFLVAALVLLTALVSWLANAKTKRP